MILCGTTPVPHRCAALVCAVTGAPAGAYCLQPRCSEVILPPSSLAAFHQNGGSLGSLDGVLVLFTAFVTVIVAVFPPNVKGMGAKNARLRGVSRAFLTVFYSSAL